MEVQQIVGCLLAATSTGSSGFSVFQISMSDKATVLVDGGYFDNINDYSRDEYSNPIDLHQFAEKNFSSVWM